MTNVDGDTVIGVEAEPGRVTILTDIKPDVADIRDLVLAASVTGTSMDEIVTALLEHKRRAGEPRSRRTCSTALAESMATTCSTDQSIRRRYGRRG